MQADNDMKENGFVTVFPPKGVVSLKTSRKITSNATNNDALVVEISSMMSTSNFPIFLRILSIFFNDHEQPATTPFSSSSTLQFKNECMDSFVQFTFIENTALASPEFSDQPRRGRLGSRHVEKGYMVGAGVSAGCEVTVAANASCATPP